MSLPVWLGEIWQTLVARLDAGTLPHALLVCGPAGLGKRALVDALVAAALCTQRRADGHACGECRSCRLLAAGSHPDRVLVTLGLRDDGKPRSAIVVDQLRELSQRLALSSQFGGLQLAIVDPADTMNEAAANALLKTLEEPAANTVIVLVADQPARLPATIRSRCQRIDVRVPSRADALAWLRAEGIVGSEAEAALDASLGNPGLALATIRDGQLALREECRRQLAALRDERPGPLALAEQWAQDRPAERLWHAAVLVRDELRRLAATERSTLGLTGPAEIPKLAHWFAEANRARERLTTTLRTDLVLLDLLRAWPGRRG